MAIRLEEYNPQKHDKKVLAELIFKSDEQMNTLTYGKNALEVIESLLVSSESYFTPEYMKCALVNDKLVGVVVYYPVSKSKEVDKTSGQGFIKAMGFLSFFKKMSLYIRMSKMMGGDLDNDGLYIHTICVDDEFRGQGIGSDILNIVAKENNKMYLYVNMKNEAAIRFYKRNGFHEKFLGKMKYKGENLGEYLMERK